MPIGSLILGVDLVPIRPVRGARTYIGDITTAETRALLRRESNGALFDVVLHDGAPNVGGAWASEAYSQAALALESLRLATDTLAPGGTFVTKVFRSKDYTPLMYALKQLFKNVEATKPAASRSTSAEIFVVCQKYKAPSKIDPRLLDPKHLFQEVTDAPRVGGPDALLKQKQAQRRFREGYEDGVSTLHKALPAATCVLQDRAIEALGAYTALELGAPAGEPSAGAIVSEKPATTAEVRPLCAALKVLGRSEFKQLLKWRLVVRKDWLKSRDKGKESEAAAEENAQPNEEEKEEDAEAALLREMEEIQSKMERAAKRERKKRRELRGKARLRAAQLAASEGIVNEDGELGMFSLPGVRGGAEDVERLTRAVVPDESDFESEDEVAPSDASSSSEEEGRDEAERYSRELDRALDRSYDAWRQGRAIKTREGGEIVKKRRRRVGMDGDLDSEEEEEGEDEALERFDDAEARGAAGGGLVVGLDERLAGVARTPAAAAAQWFGQDFFEDPDVAEDAEEEEEEDEILVAPEPSDAGRADDAEDELVESDESEDEAPAPAAAPGAASRTAPARRGADFEVVPAQASSDSESDEDDELELLDDEAKATMMAIAKKMLRRKVKDDIVEAAYSRYAFHDSDVPRWFEEEERRFMRPIAPVSAEEVREAREALRAVSARPMRKVAEAKARKAKRLNERLSKARQKAEAIAASEDGSASAKVREIERLYKDARGRGRGKKKPSRSDQYKKKGPHLDKRMKKDKRGMERAAAKKKGGKRR